MFQLTYVLIFFYFFIKFQAQKVGRELKIQKFPLITMALALGLYTYIRYFSGYSGELRPGFETFHEKSDGVV